jgi:hypothetical protein
MPAHENFSNGTTPQSADYVRGYYDGLSKARDMFYNATSELDSLVWETHRSLDAAQRAEKDAVENRLPRRARRAVARRLLSEGVSVVTGSEHDVRVSSRDEDIPF